VPNLPAVSPVATAFRFTGNARHDYCFGYKNDFPVAENKSVLFRRAEYRLGTQPVSFLARPAHLSQAQPGFPGWRGALDEIIKGCTPARSTIWVSDLCIQNNYKTIPRHERQGSHK